MATSYSNTDLKVLNYVTLRLLNFKRIQYDFLLEVIEDKFKVTDATPLLEKALLSPKIARLRSDQLSVSNEKNLLELRTELENV